MLNLYLKSRTDLGLLKSGGLFNEWCKVSIVLVWYIKSEIQLSRIKVGKLTKYL